MQSGAGQFMQLYRFPADNPLEEIPGPEIVGNKGFNLIRLARCIQVPPGFIIPVDFCRRYDTMNSEAFSSLDIAIKEEMEHLGQLTGKHFNDKRSPLLVSIRSGAAVSMPGMMETVLNIGLNEDTMRGLIRQTGNPKFAWDCLRRFIQQYSWVVHGLSSLDFEKILEEYLAESMVSAPLELDIDSLKKIATEYNTVFRVQTGTSFPYSPDDQLRSAIEAVLRSWYSNRAVVYRKIHSIPDDIGTAVIVQAMVFGNTGHHSGTGVGFTRDPASGEKEPYIDYLSNSQGEDIVSGRRNADHTENLVMFLPEVHAQLLQTCRWLEEEFRDMQDFEFTVEQKKLFFLQSRNGKRTELAALKIAVDMVDEGLINPIEAMQRIGEYDPERFRMVSFTIPENVTPIAKATSAGTGVAVGSVVFDVKRLPGYLKQKKEIIFLSRNLSTDDIEIMNKVSGLVTVLGARTSHAAVVARQMGKVCLVGCNTLNIDNDLRHCFFGDTRVTEGDTISVDGVSGHIYLGRLDQVISRPEELLNKVASWKVSGK